MLLSFHPRVEGQVFILLDWMSGLQGQEVGFSGGQPACIHGFAQGFGSSSLTPRAVPRVEICGSKVAEGLFWSALPCCSDLGWCPCLARAPVLEENRELLMRPCDKTFHCCADHFSLSLFVTVSVCRGTTSFSKWAVGVSAWWGRNSPGF